MFAQKMGKMDQKIRQKIGFFEFIGKFSHFLKFGL